MSYRFRLLLEDGEDVGEFRTLTLAWAPGDRFKAGDGSTYAVVDKVPFDDDVAFVGTLMVTPVDTA